LSSRGAARPKICRSMHLLAQFLDFSYILIGANHCRSCRRLRSFGNHREPGAGSDWSVSIAVVQPDTPLVARDSSPLGSEAAPKEGLLRSPTGMNPLTTKYSVLLDPKRKTPARQRRDALRGRADDFPPLAFCGGSLYSGSILVANPVGGGNCFFRVSNQKGRRITHGQ
jgi:hypothetical protein